MGNSSLNRVTRKPLTPPQSTPVTKQARMESTKASMLFMPLWVKKRYTMASITTLRVAMAPTEISISPKARISIMPRVIKA